MSASSTHSGIIAWFARNPVAANLLLFSVIVLGVMSLGQIRKESFPALEPDRLTISVSYNSGDPKQAEEGIALKVEDVLQGVPGIKRITSTSTGGGATVTVEKSSGYDLDALMDDVKAKVDGISNLPSDADRPVVEKMSRQDHAIWVQLYGDADVRILQDLAEKLKADLQLKPAIHDLAIKAKQEPVIAIDVDEAALQAYGLSLTDLENAIHAESLTAKGTSLRNSDKVVRIKIAEQLYDVQAFERLPVLTLANGARVRLSDIARVSNSYDEEQFSLSRYNQHNGISIEIVMDAQGDITQIADQAHEVVNDWKARGLLPDSIQLETWYDKSEEIKDRLSLLLGNALRGIALVFFFLALFLNLRVAFWVAAGLPFIFFGTVYIMSGSLVDLTINQMTTFGFIMALGIVVDDAVVVGESIYDTRVRDGDTMASTIRGTLKVAVPTIFGVLTTVAAFGALANVSGTLGQIFAQFGVVVTICLLLSMVESKLILPAHLAHLDTHRKPSLNPWRRCQQGAARLMTLFNLVVYRRLIGWTLTYRYAVILLFTSLLIGVLSMPITGAVRIAFFPDISRDVVTATLSMQDDAGFGQTHRNLLLMEQAALTADQALRREHGLPETGSSIGSLQVLASSDSAGTITVAFTESPGYTSQAFTRTWRETIGLLEGVKKLRVLARMDTGDNFRIELKSSERDSIEAAAQTLKTYLGSQPGVTSIDDNLSAGEPQYRFTLTEQGRALGMTTASLANQVLVSFGGGSVQKFQRNQDEVTVIVRYPQRRRQTLADLLAANVRTPQGAVVPLNAVAQVSAEHQVTSLTRIDSQQAVYISAAVDKAVLAPNQLVADVQQTLLPDLQAQHPYLTLEFGGEAEQQEEAVSSMELMFVAALIAIYALLAVPLGSYIQPLLIMSAIPFGVVGAILGHWLNGLSISILSVFGILALSGVVVNDSLLLVSRYNDLMAQGRAVREAIVEACTSRLRAVFLTSVTTFAGLAPILSETSMQAQFLKPAAASLGYGIVFATVITLVLIPALLLIQHDINQGLAVLHQRLFGRSTAVAATCRH